MKEGQSSEKGRSYQFFFKKKRIPSTSFQVLEIIIKAFWAKWKLARL